MRYSAAWLFRGPLSAELLGQIQMEFLWWKPYHSNLLYATAQPAVWHREEWEVRAESAEKSCIRVPGKLRHPRN